MNQPTATITPLTTRDTVETCEYCDARVTPEQPRTTQHILLDLLATQQQFEQRPHTLESIRGFADDAYDLIHELRTRLDTTSHRGRLA